MDTDNGPPQQQENGSASSGADIELVPTSTEVELVVKTESEEDPVKPESEPLSPDANASSGGVVKEPTTTVDEVPKGGRPYETLSSRQKAGIFASIVMAMFLGALDQNIVIVALPAIVNDFHQPNLLSWVISAYMLTSSATMALYGRFSDVYGRRYIYMFAISTFILGSILSGSCNGIWMLIVARGVQGIGAGGLMSLGMIVVGDIVAPEGRPKVMSAISTIFALSSVLGPLIGGGFTDGPGWRWVFWINVPLGAIALLLAFFMMRYETKRENLPLDVLGSLLIAAATICMVLFVSWGGQTGGYPWSSPIIISLIVVSVVLLGLFILQELRHPLPILNMNLFRQQNFSVIMAMMFLIGMVMLGAFAYLPVYFQELKHNSATESGFKLLPLIAGLMFFAGVASTILTKTGKFTGLLPIGASLCALGVGLLIKIHDDTAYSYIGGALFLLGLGIGFLFPVTTTIVQNSVPHADMANALSSLTFFQTVGGAIGVAIVGSILEIKTQQEIMVTYDYPEAFSYGLSFSFKVTTGIACVVFLLSWLVKSVELFNKEIALAA